MTAAPDIVRGLSLYLMTLTDAQTEMTLCASFDLYLKEGESPTTAQLTSLLNRARRIVNKKIRPYDPAVPLTLKADQSVIPFDYNSAVDVLDLYTPTGGTCKLTFRGVESGAVSPTTTAAQLKALLVALAGSIVASTDVDVSLVDALTRQYKIFWKGQYTNVAAGALTVTTNTLTGGTSTAIVTRQQQFGKRIIEIHGGVLDGQRVRDHNGDYGIWAWTAFENQFPRFLSQASGTSRLMTVQQRSLRVFPPPDSTFITDSAGTNYVAASVLEDDLIDVQDAGLELPEPVELHEVICELAVVLSAKFMSNEDEAWRRLQAVNSGADSAIEEVAYRNRMAMYPVDDMPTARRFHR